MKSRKFLMLILILPFAVQNLMASEIIVQGQILGLMHFDKYYFGKRVLAVTAGLRTYNNDSWTQEASTQLEEKGDHFFGKITLPCTRVIFDERASINDDGGCLPKVGYLIYLEGEIAPLGVYGKIINGMPLQAQYDCSYPSQNHHFEADQISFEAFNHQSPEFKAAVKYWNAINDTKETKFHLFSKSVEYQTDHSFFP